MNGSVCLSVTPFWLCYHHQGHTGQKIADFDPNWAFSDCNFRLNSLMVMKWCIKLDATRSSIKFQGHTGWKINDFNPIWVRLLGRSQLSNPSDLPCWYHRLYYKWVILYYVLPNINHIKVFIFHVILMTWNRCPHYWPPCAGNPLPTGGFPAQRTYDADLECFVQCQPEQTVEKIME